jgi:hypothetical protein
MTKIPTIKYAQDAIPIDAIPLSDVFNIVYCTVAAHPEILRQNLDQSWLDILEKNRERDRGLHPELLPSGDIERWSRLSEQNLRVDKWSVCQG